MKHKIYLLLTLLFIALFFLDSCKKHKHDNPVDQLPHATQTGANTLGFLLNGEVWTPKGRVGITSNLSVSVDQGYKNGIFNIAACRILTDATKHLLVLG